MRDKEKAVDRETLYNEVWTEPITTVAPKYGLSDVGFAKVCRSLSIPLPGRGYWAKLRSGGVVKQTPLPKLKPGESGATGLVKLPIEQAAQREAARKSTAALRKEVAPLPSPEEGAPPHPLILAASKRLRQRDGWPEDSQLRSAPGEILHLSVTRDALDRALSIADALLKALEKYGFEFLIDAKRSVTVIRSLETDTTMAFSLTEHIRRTSHEITPAEERARQRYYNRARWETSISYPRIPQYDYTPTGILTIKVGGWPSKSWKDTPRTQLEDRLKEVVAGVIALCHETHAQELERARVAEERRRALARYEFLTQQRADEAERFKQLEEQANNWERASKLRAYAAAVEEQAKAEGLLSDDLVEWLAWARAKADWLDPLILVSDAILDAPEPKKPGLWW